MVMILGKQKVNSSCAFSEWDLWEMIMVEWLFGAPVIMSYWLPKDTDREQIQADLHTPIFLRTPCGHGTLPARMLYQRLKQ